TWRAAFRRIAVGLHVEDRAGDRPVQSLLRGRRADDAALDVRSDCAGRDHVQAGRGRVIDAVLTEEEGEDGNLVNDAAARAYHGFTSAPRVPNQSEARREVVVVSLVGTVDVDADLLQSDLRIEIAEQIVPLFDHAVQIVAHPEV